MTVVNAYAATNNTSKLEPYEYQLNSIGPEDVDIDIDYCGICHSDLSMIKNEWGLTGYPIVPGHEVVGTVSAIGSNIKHVSLGDKVGLGWMSQSCMHCDKCMDGDYNLCGTVQQTIVGRHGGFASKVRCHWSWAIPLPKELPLDTAGPLFCGGLTVFNPLIQNNIKPTDKIAVIGIGGLGHLALQFMNKWGCEVTAFTSSDAKTDEAKKFGAHNVFNSRSSDDIAQCAGAFDMILSTVNATLDWEAYYNALAPRGVFHVVGAVPEPLSIHAFNLIPSQKRLTGSPVGGPLVTRKMLDFCNRHGIEAQTELFPMSKVNEALDHLESGNARYRVVLKNDIS